MACYFHKTHTHHGSSSSRNILTPSLTQFLAYPQASRLLAVYFWTSTPVILIPVPYIFYHFVQWPTNAQLIDKLSHSSYTFRHYCVILREMAVSSLPSYTSMSNAVVGNIIQNLKQFHVICGNKMPTRCSRDFYCRSYCLLNMFRAPLCPSSGAQEYYTVVAACGISCCCFHAAGLVWSWGLCVRFAGCLHPANRTHNPQLDGYIPSLSVCRATHSRLSTYPDSKTTASTYRLYIQPPHRRTSV